MKNKSKLLIAVSGTSILIAITTLTMVYGKTTAESSHANHFAERTTQPHLTHDPHGHDALKENDHNAPGSEAVAANVRLISSTIVTQNTPTRLTFAVVDPSGQPIEKFDIFQEKQMHLIAVNSDLSFFDHLHPEHKGNGVFEVLVNLPNPGNYVFFADYKPAGNPEMISVLKLSVPGTILPNVKPELSTSQVIGNTTVGLGINRHHIETGKPVNLKFTLSDANSNKPIDDLQPYLGELGHLVILRPSEQPTQADYLHAHALTQDFAGDVEFTTTFPEPGLYKVWGQFNRSGQVITAGFWVKVS